MADPDLGGHAAADSILGSLSVMVARSSSDGTLPAGFLDELVAADPTGEKLCQLLSRGSLAGARFGAGFLREAGWFFLGDGAPPPYDGLRAWLDAVAADASSVLDVLQDRDLARRLLSTKPMSGASGRRRSQALALASTGEGPDRRRAVELAAWVRERCTDEDHPVAGPLDGVAVLLSGDVLALDDIAADDHHPTRPAMQQALARMRGDQLALTALADGCTRFNRLRILGAAPQERPSSVADSCRLLDFCLRPLLGDTRRGDVGESYLRVARELATMTGLWSLVRDAADRCPDDLVAAWPGAASGRPARTAELGASRFSALLEQAAAADGLVGDLVAAARADQTA